MRLAQIEYFLEVAEQLNFTAAAKSLYISQPALSKQISLSCTFGDQEDKCYCSMEEKKCNSE